MADTGNGATFTRSGFSVDIVSIQISNAAIDTIDTSLLNESSGFMQKIAADLADPGSITINFQHDSEDTVDYYTLVGGAAVSSTVTLPIANTSNTTACTISGTTIMTEYKPPDLANNELQLCTAVFVWDGGTGPAVGEET